MASALALQATGCSGSRARRYPGLRRAAFAATVLGWQGLPGSRAAADASAVAPGSAENEPRPGQPSFEPPFRDAPPELLARLEAALVNASCANIPEWNELRWQIQQTGLTQIFGELGERLERLVLNDKAYLQEKGFMHVTGEARDMPSSFCWLGNAFGVSMIELLRGGGISIETMKGALSVKRLLCFDLMDYSGWPMQSSVLMNEIAILEVNRLCAHDNALVMPPWCRAVQGVAGTDLLDVYHKVFLSACRLFDGRPATGVECVADDVSLGSMLPTSSSSHMSSRRVRVAATGLHAPYTADLLTLWRRFFAPAWEVQTWNFAVDAKRCAYLGGCDRHSAFEELWHIGFFNQTVARCDGIVTRGFFDLEAAAAMLESHVLRDPVLAAMDIFVCTHPVASCRAFWPLVERHNFALIGYVGSSLEIGVHRENLKVWLDDFLMLAAHPRVVLVAQTPFLAEKVHFSTGRLLPAVRPFGAHIQAQYTPIRSHEWDVLVWKTSSDCMDNLSDMLAVLHALVRLCNARLSGSGLSSPSPGVEAPLQFFPLRGMAQGTESEGRKPSYEELSSYRATAMFPYDLTVISFYELYYMGMPIFMPGPVLAQQYAWRGADVRWFNCELPLLPGHVPWHAASPHALHDSPAALQQWLRFADWFRWPEVQTFESLHELVFKLLTTDVQALRTISMGMRRFNEESLVRAAAFWYGVFQTLLT